ncbi:hypothetical protein TNCV_231561 [Trichonephila clavipes]|nr:hypothetical protein TNCV_231561 [Trichonephila clavipes]
MSSPPDRMPFSAYNASERLDHCNLWPRTPESSAFSAFIVLCHRTASLCAMEIKLPSSGLLLIVMSLWRLIQLLDVKFPYSAFNTLAKIYFHREPCSHYSLPRHLQIWATYQAFDGLTASGRHFGPPFLCYSEVV